MAHCCICDYNGPFKSYRSRIALCPSCRSLERHRSLFHVLKLLGFYPSKARREILSVSVDRQYFGRLMLYHSMAAIDKRGGKYTVKADVTALPFEDGRFDAVIQSHCIEHVPNDKKATSEIARVMKLHGTYVSCVPIVDEHIDYAKPGPPNYHQRDYSVASYRKLLTGFFDPVEVCDLSQVPDLGTYIFVAFKGGKG